ncbi:MAG: hypothetical protein HKN85_08405, partial [Gammaproteobacteria bacterium]|nr:hypothetical protein [Gammaproteobacteria bacterium]
MDSNWTQNLDQYTAVIVPTRSLASAFSAEIAHSYLDQGQAVWEAPNILTWPEYLTLLWQCNRNKMTHVAGAHTLISAQQSLVLWTRVIEESRRQEQA